MNTHLTDRETLPGLEAPVLGIKSWQSNGHLIADCARLGYLQRDWRTLDCTYGYGTFWSVWRPLTQAGTATDQRQLCEEILEALDSNREAEERAMATFGGRIHGG